MGCVVQSIGCDARNAGNASYGGDVPYFVRLGLRGVCTITPEYHQTCGICGADDDHLHEFICIHAVVQISYTAVAIWIRGGSGYHVESDACIYRWDSIVSHEKQVVQFNLGGQDLSVPYLWHCLHCMAV